MADIAAKFSHIFDWTLQRGSHAFPGPDGGTCINEAAIVAAGFEYRQIGTADDCPPCFSRVLSTVALALNDCLPNWLRNRLLMPFVTRLAGTADSETVEMQRADYMTLRGIREILPLLCELDGRPDLAALCRDADNLEEGRRAALVASASNFARASAYASASAYAYVAKREGAHAVADRIADIAVDILDGAMKIGRQPDPLEHDLVTARMEAAKRGSDAPRVAERVA